MSVTSNVKSAIRLMSGPVVDVEGNFVLKNQYEDRIGPKGSFVLDSFSNVRLRNPQPH